MEADPQGKDALMVMPAVQRETLDLNGWWHVWYDDAAEWRNDAPAWPNTPLQAVRPHMPSAGWDGMEEGMESHQVPGTWEQSRPGHHGVAWYWRPLVIPQDWQGRVVRLRFEAVRLWAEVYLDEELVGYDLDGLTPFEIDLSGHVRPGRAHTLAVRVTNPGGVETMTDRRPIRWAGLDLPASYDLGGIWGDVTLLSTSRPYIQDLFVRPSADLSAVVVDSQVGRYAEDLPMALHIQVRDGAGEVVAEARRPVAWPDELGWIKAELPISQPRLWSPGDPHCYSVQVALANALGSDALQATFGMRRFAWENGHLSLNGEHIWPKASRTRSWYAEHGAFPRPSWAEQEVQTALGLGLNMLWAQDHPPASALLEAADRQGLLLCSAQSYDLPSAASVRARALYWRLLRRRVRRLVRRDRNHPSLVWWALSAGDWLKSPRDGRLDRDDSRSFASLARVMRREDPSCLLTWDARRGHGMALSPYQLGSPSPLPSRDSAELDRCQPERARPGAFALHELASPASLPDLPSVVARHGDRILVGSVEHTIRSWLRQLEAEFQRHHLGRTFADVSDLCRATQASASEGLSRAIQQGRLEPNHVGYVIDGWASQGAAGTGGLVDLWRRPQVNGEALRRAQGPVMLACADLPRQLYVNERATVSLYALSETGPHGRMMLRTYLLREGSPCLDRRIQPVSLGGCRGKRLAQIPLCPEHEGLHWLHVELLQDGTVLACARQSFWATRRSQIEPQGIHLVDELGLLPPGERGPWRTRTLATRQETDAALIVSYTDPRELAAWLDVGRSQGRRVALFLSQPPDRREDLWRVLRRLGVLEEAPQPFALDGPGQLSWVLSHHDPLLLGVAPPGVWGSLQAGLRPHFALRGLLGVAQGCVLTTGRRASHRAVQMGATLGILPLAEAQLLISTLPLAEALGARLPIAERLLTNVLHWLRDARDKPTRERQR
jgi:hypothetical protein